MYKSYSSPKNFHGREELGVYRTRTPNGHLCVNLIALLIRSRIISKMRSSVLQKKYSEEKMLLELYKLRNVVLQDGKKNTMEITRKQKEMTGCFGIKPEYVPTFLKSQGRRCLYYSSRSL
ncbi:MAG: hypothetical protein QW478_05545 [Candidatus Micrarchaeaceae archaeon]